MKRRRRWRRRFRLRLRWRSSAVAFAAAVLATIDGLGDHREASPGGLLIWPAGQTVAFVIENDVAFTGRHTRLILLDEVVKRECEVRQFGQCAKTLGNKPRQLVIRNVDFLQALQTGEALR